MRVKLNFGIYLLQNIELKKLKEIKATYGSKGINNLTLNDKNELMNLVTIWFYDDPNESDD